MLILNILQRMYRNFPDFYLRKEQNTFTNMSLVAQRHKGKHFYAHGVLLVQN